MPPQDIGIRPTVPQRVSLAIGNASKRTGVPFDYLMAQARVESSLNPDAQASTSSAAGLFQFTRQTWLATLSQHGAEHGLDWVANAISKSADGQYRVDDPQMRDQILGLRFDPEISSAMAAEFADDNASMLRSRFGEEPQPVDLYLAHFLGAQGAAQFLSAWRADPNAPAAPLVPAAASANRTIFYNSDGSPRSLDAIRSHFAARLDERPSGFPAPGTTRTQMATRTGSNIQSSQEFMQMRTIEPMPQSLSLAFAERAYQRLARIDGGSAA